MISLSFASVLVIREKSLMLAAKVAAMAWPAASRVARSVEESLLRAAETVRSSPLRGTLRAAMVSSNRRDQAERPVTSFSCRSFSSWSSSWCGHAAARLLQRSRPLGLRRHPQVLRQGDGSALRN